MWWLKSIVNKFDLSFILIVNNIVIVKKLKFKTIFITLYYILWVLYWLRESMLLFFLIFISVPLVEIYLFIIVGKFIGSLETVLLVILTAIIGGFLIKREGIKTLNYIKFSKISEPKNFIKALKDGLFIVVSGILLLTPGFATDLFGFILFLKPIRDFIVKFFLKKIKLSEFSWFYENN